MFLLRIVKLIVVCSVFSVCASQDELSVSQLAFQSNKGNKQATYLLACRYLDLLNENYNKALGKSLLEKMAQERYMPAMNLLAQYYAYFFVEPYTPSRALFWYRVLALEKQDVNEYLKGFALLSTKQSPKIGKELIASVVAAQRSNTWESHLFLARVFELGVVREKSLAKARHYYKLVEKQGVNVDFFLETVNKEMFAPKLLQQGLLGHNFDEISKEIITSKVGRLLEVSRTDLKVIELFHSKTMVSKLGFKLDNDKKIIEVTQYFNAVNKAEFMRIESLYLARLGRPFSSKNNAFFWRIKGLSFRLIHHKNLMDRLIVTLR